MDWISTCSHLLCQRGTTNALAPAETGDPPGVPVAVVASKARSAGGSALAGEPLVCGGVTNGGELPEAPWPTAG